MDTEEDDEMKHLSFFANSISSDIFYAFVGYRTLSGNSNVVNGSIKKLARLYICVATLVTCLIWSENSGGYGQKV